MSLLGELPADGCRLGGQGELLLEASQADPIPVREGGLCQGRVKGNQKVPVFRNRPREPRQPLWSG